VGSTYYPLSSENWTLLVAIYHSCSLINAGKIDPGDKLDGGGGVWVGLAAVDIQAVDPILMHALELQVSPIARPHAVIDHLTCGGPNMVPFQLDIDISSPSERPYEHASRREVTSLPRTSAKKARTHSYQHQDLSLLSRVLRVDESCGVLLRAWRYVRSSVREREECVQKRASLDRLNMNPLRRVDQASAGLTYSLGVLWEYYRLQWCLFIITMFECTVK
jgi:hypothetical protein